MRLIYLSLLCLSACQLSASGPGPAPSGLQPVTNPSGSGLPTGLPQASVPMMASPVGAAAPSRAPAPSASCEPTRSRAYVELAGRRIPVDVAWDQASRTKGLSGRPCLARGTGLVLGFDTPSRTGIWMPDMNFAIDVLFVRDGRVIDLYEAAQPCVPDEPCPVFGPGVPVDYVLEVPAGSAQEWGVAKGAAIQLVR
ncbi:MAG: DUF192 domain-containing protein [Candidatus Sericytochromatia bacterium]|nr:DUF192 domain-containing protein [Candidatus Sericytochromatia bacterium]